VTASSRRSDALRRFAARLSRRLRALRPGHRTTYVSERVAEYRAYWDEAAKELGASFEELLPGVWEVRLGDRRARLANHVTECDNPVVLQLAGDKPFGYALAQAAGVPVPEYCVATLGTLSQAERFLERVGGPLVVKPASGSSSGLGVTTGVRAPRDLRSAVALSALYDHRVLVERMVPGESYRLLYVAGRAVHVVRRRGLRVVADGRLSIASLLEVAGHRSLLGDSLVRETLAMQHLTLASVPRSNEQVLVRGLPAKVTERRELRTVYDEAVLSQCSPELLRQGAEVVRRLGSEFAGVDLITTNPALSLRESGGAFIEINTTPGIHHHYVGPRDNGVPAVGVQVLDYILSERVAARERSEERRRVVSTPVPARSVQ
jgi:hypothetical protein